jgi:DNA polymerase V
MLSMQTPSASYALIDCNNFFVSCERLFRPELNGRPVVVLSSNDGCAVSRSQEAKDLGIPMGAPHFQYRDFFKQHGVVAFSANFELYGDISERITNLLASITPQIEVYSIDESFLNLGQLDIADYTSWGRGVRASILKNVGIPVSIGIAPSKTLTKLANDRAKKLMGVGGVLDLSVQGESTDRYLAQVPVADIWGVGRKLAPVLRAEGLHSALDVRLASAQRLGQLMGVRGRQLQAELNGTTCFPLMQTHKPQAMIMRGRQFGEDTREFHVIESAVASLAARAAAALRREGSLARRASVSLRTNRHKPGYQSYQESVQFLTPTADTGTITRTLIDALDASFRASLEYHRADVLLDDFVSSDGLQTDLLGSVDLEHDDRSQRKMRALDAINLRHGRGTVKFAAEDLSRAWQPRRNLSSPRYTSDWRELPEVKLQ